MYDLQLLFVTASNERREKLVKQIFELGIPFKIQFIDAYTPLNNLDYIQDTSLSEYDKKIICCGRSHIKAIEFAAQNESPKFSLILEDDVAFHKDEFIPKIINIINTWDSFMSKNSDMLSIGWVPYRNYGHYVNETNCNYIDSKYKVLNCFYFGLQAYVITKEAAKQVLPHILAPTYEQFKKQMLESKLPYIDAETNFLQADQWINRMFRQKALFPLLAIEQKNNNSIIGDHNPGGNDKVFIDFFHGYESERLHYWSY